MVGLIWILYAVTLVRRREGYRESLLSRITTVRSRTAMDRAYVSIEFPQTRPIQTDNKYLIPVNAVPGYTWQNVRSSVSRFRQKYRRDRTSMVEQRFRYKNRMVFVVLRQMLRILRSPTLQNCAVLFLRMVNCRPARYRWPSLLLFLLHLPHGQKKNITRIPTRLIFNGNCRRESFTANGVLFHNNVEIPNIFTVLVV